MATNPLRRWCRPGTILVVSDFSESPAHTLRVISGVRTAGAKVVLVQIPYPAYASWRLGSDLHVRTSPTTSIEYRSMKAADQAFLWAEILSEVTVLRNTPIERIPALADSLGAEMVVLTKTDIGHVSFQIGNTHEVDLFGSLKMPVMVCGEHSGMSSWSARAVRKILVPVLFGAGLDLQMRFACRYARRHHGRLTVLHVFESGEMVSKPWERTPLVVEAKLPIVELKKEGILCPLEIAISEGYPERRILAFNEQKPHDLIIMGGPRRRDPIHGLGQSVAVQVIAEARCPVLVLGGAIMPFPACSAESASHRIPTQHDQRKGFQVGG